MVQFGDQEKKTDVSQDSGAEPNWGPVPKSFSFDRRDEEYIVLKVMNGNELLGDVKLLVDNYATHCHQELTDTVTLVPNVESMEQGANVLIRLEWWPSDEQFNNDFDDLSAPEFD